MVESTLKIINDFVDYIIMGGGDYSDWYIGICKDAKSIFLEHGVREIRIVGSSTKQDP